MLYTGLVLVMPSSTLTSEAGSRDFFRFKRPIQERNHMELAYNKYVSGVDMSSDTILGVGRLPRVAPENRKVSNDPRDGLGKQW